VSTGGDCALPQVVDRDAGAGADVDDERLLRRIVEGEQPGVGHISDVDKVSGLLAVAVNLDGLVAEGVAQEDAEDALVWVGQRLSLPIDVEHTESHGADGRGGITARDYDGTLRREFRYACLRLRADWVADRRRSSRRRRGRWGYWRVAHPRSSSPCRFRSPPCPRRANRRIGMWTLDPLGGR